MQSLRGRLILVSAVMALLILRLAEPRPGVYFHDHAGGDHVHVHDDAIALHGWDDAHPHVHPHPHTHSFDHVRAAELQRLFESFARVRATTPAAAAPRHFAV